MKQIIACVKLVPAAAEVALDGQFRLKRDSTSLQLNIADLSAVEAALGLKEADTQVTVLSMGPAKGEALLQELFALGVDRVVLLSDRALAGADSLATARALAAGVRCLGEFSCILCGRRALDAETGQIPGQLAAALDIPAVTNGQQLEKADNGLSCRRLLETAVETLTVELPCVVSLCEYSYTLRLPSILGRRRAKDKQVEILTAADIGLVAEQCGLQGSKTKVVHVDTKAPGLRKCSYCNPEALCGIIKGVQ
ncbi:MAG: electron transfer flavoprotein subunit beta/FixA family protein [Oscillospiraceae bacterium]|nr:electron transfer flavoprotein subunit beta/FixA family protein [Oscillospiraceae bacterium]